MTSPKLLRVLVVDDYRDTRRALRMLLMGWGYEAREAADGEEALSIAAEFCPDLVFLDLGLPGLDGFEVGRRLRLGSVALVLVALTGHGGLDFAQAAREAGFDHFLAKPCGAELIRSLLRGDTPAAD